MSGESETNLSENVRALQAGQTSAFEALVKQTENRARKLAYSLVGPNHFEDVLQESYTIVFRKIKQVKNPDAFMGWLCRLIIHVCYRYRSKIPDTTQLDDQQPADSNTEQILDSIVLRNALNQLQPKDRDLLILKELLSLKYEEISHALQIPVGTVRSRLFSARKRLQERLASMT